MTRHCKILVALFPLIFCCAARAAESATTLPSTPRGSFDVFEWVIFVSDVAQPQLNGENVFRSTLPDFADSRRNMALPEKRNVPQPMGVIRFRGDSGADKVDVLLGFSGAKVMAAWPKPQTRAKGILWQDLVVTDTPPASLPQLPTNSWFNALRSTTSPFLTKDGRGERFLLYDLAFADWPAIEVSTGSSANHYSVSNRATEAVHDLNFYKHQTDGWHTGALDLLPAKNTKPSSTTKPKPLAHAATTVASTQVVAHASTRASTQASTQAATQPADFSVALSGTPFKTGGDVLAAWRQKLSTAGLPEMDQKLILEILEKNALDEKRLSAIYMIAPEQLDQMIPLEVTPQPRKTVRVGLVIVRNIDPAIGQEIDDLVAQLGDNSWSKRQAAQKTLEKLGKVAQPKLEKLRSAAKDPEVMYRLDQIIGVLANPAPANNDNQVDNGQL